MRPGGCWARSAARRGGGRAGGGQAGGGPAGGGQAGGGPAGGPGRRPGSGADGGAGPRRFTLAEVTGLIEGAGLRPGAAHGIRVFTDLVPGSFADVDPGAADALLALEQAASTHPAFHDFAAQFHVLGYR